MRVKSISIPFQSPEQQDRILYLVRAYEFPVILKRLRGCSGQQTFAGKYLRITYGSRKPIIIQGNSGHVGNLEAQISRADKKRRKVLFESGGVK